MRYNLGRPLRRNAVVVLVGVSGSGKSTVGRLLARELRCKFYEGDDYHLPSSREKMSRGVPLTDADRWPWLAALRKVIAGVLARGQCAVLACSALKRAYRDCLRQPGVQFVYLKGSYDLIHERLEQRRGHFFDPHLLASQFQTLEEPQRAIVVDITKSPGAVVREICRRLKLRAAETGHRFCNV